jgi:hypothetical protein
VPAVTGVEGADPVPVPSPSTGAVDDAEEARDGSIISAKMSAVALVTA